MCLDKLFRQLNKNNLLILEYHGVCRREDCPPLFTQLPSDLFRDQLQFLAKNYNIISLDEVISCLREKKPFPKRSALVTFDDGYMNNYKVAFPLLKEFNIPATIFLTVDFMGSNNMLWFDELFLLVKQALSKEIDISVLAEIFDIRLSESTPATLYPTLSNALKKLAPEERFKRISALKEKMPLSSDDAMAENLKLLSWKQIREMSLSGLISFGVHTATHRILIELASKQEFEREILRPKHKLSQKLGCEILSFCYPNGIPDIDFTDLHVKYLKQANYLCAFTGEQILNSPGGDPFRLGRKLVGNDITSELSFFSLNLAGFFDPIRVPYHKFYKVRKHVKKQVKAELS